MRVAPLGFIAATLLLAAIIINPFREMFAQDDAWAFARMVQHLLATGTYQLDSFLAPNVPVQIYIAAGLSKIFGYSPALLRLTTLALLVVALVSFYLLLRELGHARQMAGTITLAILASPLVLILGFAFMSDVQALAWVVLALLLYVRGFRNQSLWSMFFGSLAAGCAIGTRQFTIALIAGLIFAWLFSSPPARPPFRLILIGLVVPLLAGAGQLYIGFRTPNFTQASSLASTHAFLHLPAHVLLWEAFWRCAIIAQYLGMALLPLLPLTLTTPRSFWKERVGRIPIWVLSLLGCALIVAALVTGSLITPRPVARHRGLWEPLVLNWVLPVNFDQSRPTMRLLDLAGIVGAGSLFGLALHQLRSVSSLRRLRPETLLFAGTASVLLVLHLIFNQINDSYIIGFLPFLLLLAANGLRNIGVRSAMFPVSVASSVLLVLAVSFWMRGEYAPQEATWASAEALYRTGVPPSNIFATYHWEVYHGAYDDWIAAGHPGGFSEWLSSKDLEKPYAIRLAHSPAPPPAGWKLVASSRYRNFALKKRYVLTMERNLPR